MNDKSELTDIVTNTKRHIINAGEIDSTRKKLLLERVTTNRNGMINVYHQCARDTKNLKLKISNNKSYSKDLVKTMNSAIGELKSLKDKLKLGVSELDYYTKKWKLQSVDTPLSV